MISKADIVAALFSKGISASMTINGESGIVQSVTRESGCGHKFIIRMWVKGEYKNFYVVTVDW